MARQALRKRFYPDSSRPEIIEPLSGVIAYSERQSEAQRSEAQPSVANMLAFVFVARNRCKRGGNICPATTDLRASMEILIKVR